MAAKSLVFEYELKHKLQIIVKGGVVAFDESQQEIYLTKLKVQPAIDLQKVEVKAYYPEGAKKQIAAAVSRILNVHAKPTATKETMRGEKTMRSVEAIREPSGASGQESKTKDESTPVKEAAIPDMYIDVVSDMLAISGNYNVDGSTFKVTTTSEDMMKIITFRKSKYVKVFINGKEFKPQDEVEFVRRVFPQIDMTVHMKQ